ncbi:M24 family metallopeptidase [Clostridium frigidicarnis]|uniref:Xaa-Pro aminopeptidase n=1 Tax=Clostridium frigidicarnis TaxID=84698 RepID=A0A1I0YXP9_9CLOT|nr:Xaa-Pro peptidase family protein [Clostridium frigidicarnis]SFB18051.1 Xaa-Pro aminopeptidase [Clostridium frigidicarnis]
MDRIKELLEKLKEQKLEGIFLTKESNVNYISNFSDEAAFALICEKGNFLITDGRFTELAESLCKGFTIVNWHKFDRNLQKAVAIVCKENEINKLGFEKTHMTFDVYKKLENEAKSLDIELIPTEGLVEELRYIKDSEEIENLRKACKIADKALEELLPYIKPGISENDLAAKLEYYMKVNGAQSIGFETILISGSKTSLPHGKPNNKVIENGDFVTIDFGALYNGYISDMTRTFVVGQPSEEQIKVYNLVKDAQEVGLNSLKPGICSKVPDDNIREIIKEYEKFYYPGIGHGVGRELHEQPFLGNYGTKIIEAGCVITVEPGLYIPGWGGVRIEDTVLVKEEGIEILTHFSKDLIILK